MIQQLFRKADTLQSEVLIESAYFVTQDKAFEEVKKLTERGVRVGC
jgi:phosphatidylserine/phosphatidylglycerophosphate/cardiolipin synthase-like enzyme